MNTVFLDHSGYALEKDGGAVVVRDADGKRLAALPGKHLDRLVIQGDVTLTTGLMTQLLQGGTEILLMSKRNSYRVCTILGAPHGNAFLRIRQYAIFQQETQRLQAARWVVRAKLRSQEHYLRQLLAEMQSDRRLVMEAIRRLQKLRQGIGEAATLDQLLGIEGSAAAAYFPAFFQSLPKGFQCESRTRRPPTDPTNALLSLGYTLLHHEAVSVAYGAGLDPYVGFLHALDYNRESLACDLVESLRAHIDRFVRQMLIDRSLREEHFNLDKGACLLGKAGRGHFYALYARQVNGLRRHLRHLAALASTFIRHAHATATVNH